MSAIGERRFWPAQKQYVRAVAECPGWIFVMPEWAARPFAVPYAIWIELDDPSQSVPLAHETTAPPPPLGSGGARPGQRAG